MISRGISIEGLVSEMGALERNSLQIDEDVLVAGLKRRFRAEEYEANGAIRKAIKAGVIRREIGKEGQSVITLILE